ncbi:MAG: acyltransferase [Bacteroidaceae bacterium]|nr:acyltransferase [Bacteroidaceae bacterium]
MIKRIWIRLSTLWYFIFFVRNIGKGSRIISPLKIDGGKNIRIGRSVFIQYKTWLAALPLTGEDNCLLEIGDGSIIGHFNHIYCTKSIKIGKKVLTADKVYISDNLHGFSDITIPILEQPIIQNGEVEIGDGTWIGENVCILGVKIGKNCVVGANSVVTKNIPDYCVAVGAPAYIIKRYCFDSKEWKKTDKVGNFIK